MSPAFESLQLQRHTSIISPHDLTRLLEIPRRYIVLITTDAGRKYLENTAQGDTSTEVTHELRMEEGEGMGRQEGSGGVDSGNIPGRKNLERTEYLLMQFVRNLADFYTNLRIWG